MYGKIFASIYDGTLRVNWQALVTFQQLIVLCDADGTVDMTAHAIAGRTGIPLDIIETGLAFLESPDPYSRTPDEDGRRISRLSDDRAWGWYIVNHSKYKALVSAATIREQNRERKRKQRDMSRSVTASHAESRHTDTDTDTDPPIVPQRVNGHDHAFEEFWRAYPRKRSKGNALKAWKRLKPDATLTSTILAAVERARGSPDWKRESGQFVPYPASWLNARGWEDDIAQQRIDKRRVFGEVD